PTVTLSRLIARAESCALGHLDCAVAQLTGFGAPIPCGDGHVACPVADRSGDIADPALDAVAEKCLRYFGSVFPPCIGQGTVIDLHAFCGCFAPAKRTWQQVEKIAHAATPMNDLATI